MRWTAFALLASAVALALLPARAAAQDWDPDDDEYSGPRVDVSVSAGGMVPTSWSGTLLLGSISSSSGVVEQVLSRDLRVEPKSDFTGSITYWRGRYGFRTQAGFSRSSLRVGGVPAGGNPVLTSQDLAVVGVDTFLYDVRGAIGFVDYRPERRVWPYGFFGLGGITYRLDNEITPPLAFVGSGPLNAAANANTIVVRGSGEQFVLGVNSLSTETVLAFNFGVGTDLRIPLGAGGVGLRVEVADQVSESPVQVQLQAVAGGGAFQPASAVRFPLVHQLSATAGLVVHIGR